VDSQGVRKATRCTPCRYYNGSTGRARVVGRAALFRTSTHLHHWRSPNVRARGLGQSVTRPLPCPGRRPLFITQADWRCPGARTAAPACTYCVGVKVCGSPRSVSSVHVRSDTWDYPVGRWRVTVTQRKPALWLHCMHWLRSSAQWPILVVLLYDPPDGRTDGRAQRQPPCAHPSGVQTSHRFASLLKAPSPSGPRRHSRGPHLGCSVRPGPYSFFLFHWALAHGLSIRGPGPGCYLAQFLPASVSQESGDGYGWTKRMLI
jgi:hypothetical protein